MARTTTDRINILLVEDDINLSMILQDYLEMVGFSCTLGNDGEEGLKLFGRNTFDLCILDVMMPKMDGFTLAGEIRKRDATIPIIFLTAKSLKADRIKGFEQGCDDYITKPFSTEELNLRIRAILRRCNRGNMLDSTILTERFNIGIYTFDVPDMSLTYNGERRVLTRKEVDLLKLLCIHRNRLLPREMALSLVWGGTDYFTGRSMDVFISKLRRYLKDDPNVSIITMHGSGFRLEVRYS
jgi:two-component system, OmpR family, response regulator